MRAFNRDMSRRALEAASIQLLTVSVSCLSRVAIRSSFTFILFRSSSFKAYVYEYVYVYGCMCILKPSILSVTDAVVADTAAVAKDTERVAFEVTF